jgi:predicted lipid carrier protein YhbT
MTPSLKRSAQSPTLSPVLLAGLFLRPLPLAGLQPLLNLAIRTMKARHGDVFERLDNYGPLRFVIDPTDLPFCFELIPSSPSLLAIESEAELEGQINAIIRGPLFSLLALLEGRVDGDALFFSRTLVIEGDTEAVLTLRNAIDGADIDILSDALSPLGGMATPARKVAEQGVHLFSRLASDLDTIAQSVRAPASKQLNIQSADIRDLNDRVDEIARKLRRPSKNK